MQTLYFVGCKYTTFSWETQAKTQKFTTLTPFFNGGGHLNASGGEFYGTMDEAIELFKQALVKYEELLLAKK